LLNITLHSLILNKWISFEEGGRKSNQKSYRITKYINSPRIFLRTLIVPLLVWLVGISDFPVNMEEDLILILISWFLANWIEIGSWRRKSKKLHALWFLWVYEIVRTKEKMVAERDGKEGGKGELWFFSLHFQGFFCRFWRWKRGSDVVVAGDVVVAADVERRQRKCEGRRRNMKTADFMSIFYYFI
jgi:hypothetical protein